MDTILQCVGLLGTLIGLYYYNKHLEANPDAYSFHIKNSKLSGFVMVAWIIFLYLFVVSMDGIKDLW